MKTKKKNEKRNLSARRTRLFRAAIFASVLLVLGAVTVIARYGSRKPISNSSAEAEKNFVTVEVGGKKLRVNAATLQQGPLTQDQSQQIADALQNNKSTDGLVQVQHADGTVEMDLQGRFQNVMIAKKNDDGSVSQACVDSSEAAKAFLQSKDTTTAPETPRKAALQQ
jgi:hypothetical protein